MKNLASFRISNFLLLFASLFFSTSNDLLAQTTWTGSNSTAWNTAGNWSAGVPDATDDVTIPNVTNDPVISTAGISVKSLVVQSGGLLGINAGASLSINGSSGIGLLNQGTVNNSGTINIGNSLAVVSHGLRNEAIFNNNSGSQIIIDRVPTAGAPSALFNTNNGTFTNAGTITLGAVGTGGTYGLQNFTATFNNQPTGIINISSASTYGLYSVNPGFTNSGNINIGPAGSGTINTGFVCNGNFTNSTGAQIRINRSVYGVWASGSTLSNAGIINIGEETAMSNLMHPSSAAVLSNDGGGIFKGTGTVKAANFVNAGGTLSPGYASAGKLSFNASEDFTSSIMSMEVNGTGVAGVNYDQVAVTGTATLGGTLALNINFPTAVNGDQVTIVSATAISGTFGSVTGLLPNWKVTYTATSVLLSYDVTTTWTGAISSSWNTAGNWTNGVPTSSSMVTIPNVTIDPVISVAGANALTVHVQAGAILSIMNTGSLTTHGVATYNAVTTGLYNQGTVHNSGILTVNKP